MQRKTEPGGTFRDERDKDIPAHIKEVNELIRKAQNRNGSVPRETRDEAIMELCRRFAKLIRRHAKRVYRSASGISPQEWHHEALTIFIELVLDDYRLKEEGGSAFFGTYITQKLYFRLLYKSQESVRHYRRHGTFDPQEINQDGMHDANRVNYSTNEERIDIGINDDGLTVRSALREMPTEVFNSVVNNFRGVSCGGADDPVIEEDRRSEIIAEAMNVMRIAKMTLKDRDYQIFEWRFMSGLTFKEIAKKMKMPTSSVTYIANNARNAVLAELGRRHVGRTLS